MKQAEKGVAEKSGRVHSTSGTISLRTYKSKSLFVLSLRWIIWGFLDTYWKGSSPVTLAPQNDPELYLATLR
jgi:hypothetical protein